MRRTEEEKRRIREAVRADYPENQDHYSSEEDEEEEEGDIIDIILSELLHKIEKYVLCRCGKVVRVGDKIECPYCGAPLEEGKEATERMWRESVSGVVMQSSSGSSIKPSTRWNYIKPSTQTTFIKELIE